MSLFVFLSFFFLLLFVLRFTVSDYFSGIFKLFLNFIYLTTGFHLIISKTKVLLPQPILDIMFMPFGFIAPQILNYLAFQSFDFVRTWWWLFQKRVVRTKFDIYGCCFFFFFSSFLYSLWFRSRTGTLFYIAVIDVEENRCVWYRSTNKNNLQTAFNSVTTLSV